MDTTSELQQYEGEQRDAPTEEQKGKREDYRRKREKISGVMGQYLLKGYRMLATTCETCGNILLQTRDGVDYCVQCSEFGDARPNGDAKVESGLKDSCSGRVTSHSNQHPMVSPVLNASATCIPGVVRESLLYKLQWASSQLRETTSVECSIALCQLIKVCLEALQSVGTASASVNS